uniref:Uncharacterized protein n=1 Tax=Lymantria dispar multicapsid nuclear polyhedrosis virus TaxID=10449 RepID=A0A6H0F053_NPVLD|nr:hypothetical protein [Lymantria dispar multiple nucleopolyhedrovirus]
MLARKLRPVQDVRLVLGPRVLLQPAAGVDAVLPHEHVLHDDHVPRKVGHHVEPLQKVPGSVQLVVHAHVLVLAQHVPFGNLGLRVGHLAESHILSVHVPKVLVLEHEQARVHRLGYGEAPVEARQ